MAEACMFYMLIAYLTDIWYFYFTWIISLHKSQRFKGLKSAAFFACFEIASDEFLEIFYEGRQKSTQNQMFLSFKIYIIGNYFF